MKGITDYWQTLNFVSIMLTPLSLLFCLLVFIRRQAYRVNFFKSTAVNIPIIVVGNIYIGGNGKTPFVIWLVKQLQQAGYKPGVVSRGYGAISEQDSGIGWPRLVNSQDEQCLFADEPLLIHQSAQCPVVIDPHRTRAVHKIVSDTDCDVIISDDGLQHYAMARFIEIHITDAKRLYGNKMCLPGGPLREPVSRLKSIDFSVYNISRGSAADTLPENSFTMDYEFSALKSLSKAVQQSMTVTDFKGKIVHAVAGIGDPEQFFALLKSYGLTLVEHAFADHYHYKKEDVLFADAYPIIMTEKDAVKCRSFALRHAWYLPLKAKIDNTLLPKIVQQLQTF